MYIYIHICVGTCIFMCDTYILTHNAVDHFNPHLYLEQNWNHF